MMRLRRLDLEFFGHFTGRSFDFGVAMPGGSDVHVVYGPNEAGKTTLMEGYLRLLYGFAARGEPYAFKHGRPALRVSAELEIDGTPRMLTRLPKRTGGLVDASGAALPETALAPALGDLTQDEYRKLLCLDDATIETGGDEIVASEGDIGRLLFSAAAGVSDLSTVLDSARGEADALYLKKGRSSAFHGLKRARDELKAQIAEIDIDAVRLGTLRRDVQAATEAEQSARTDRRARLEARDRLAALRDALPLAAGIAQAEAALAPLAHYPQALEADPEALVALLQAREGHAVDQRRLEAELAEARAARDAIARAPEGLALKQPLDDLRALRDRCASAAPDLPQRRADLAGIVAQMRARLSEIAPGTGADPTGWVLSEPALAELERKVHAVTMAQQRLDSAEAEARTATADAGEALRVRDRALTARDAAPDLAPILARHDADRVIADFAGMRSALAQAERRRDAALLDLDIAGAVPVLPVSADAASALAAALTAADAECTRTRQALDEARGAAARASDEIALREAAPGLVSDADAAETRTTRDRLWGAHRAVLDAATADAFEQALATDDAVGAARQAAAGALGEIVQLRLAHAEATRAVDAAQSAQATADAAHAALAATLAAHLTALGLSPETEAGAFAEWLRRAEAAVAAERALEVDARAASPVVARADALAADLAAALGPEAAPPGTSIDALVTLARSQATQREARAAAWRAAQDALEQAEAQTRRRIAARDDALDARETARAGLDAAVAAHLPEALDVPVADALPILRALRAMEGERAGLARQVAGMERDAAALAASLAPLIDAHPDLAGGAPVAAFDTLAQRLAEADAQEQAWHALTGRIETAEAALATARQALDRIDAETKSLAQTFASAHPPIPAATLEELRTALADARQADALRNQIDEDVRRLCTRLDTPSRTEAEALIGSQGAAELQAALDEAERDIATLDETCRAAGVALGAAQAALAHVTASGDVAALASRRQTVELEMEQTILRHLRLSLGLRLADQAIRRYRDTHRSGMMASAEAAFRALTNGAYGQLSVQDDGAREVLVAVAADGAAKQVHDMSKGTRFQLYLALRAAAYEQMARSGTVLPFFCDDVFETFDEDRTRAACGVMQRIGEIGQAIYLTHHAHVVEIAREVCGDALTLHRI